MPPELSKYRRGYQEIIDNKLILIFLDWIPEEMFDVMNKINYKPDYIISFLFLNYQMPNNNYTWNTPLVAELQQQLLTNSNAIIIPTNLTTTACFNFNINKKQINRHLLIKLVEWFKLDKFNYTWSGVDRFHTQDEIAHILAELDTISQSWSTDLFKSHLQSEINIPPNWITVNRHEIKNNYAVCNYGDNREVWNNGLHKIVSTSAVSIIGESVGFHKGAAFTEKTLFAMLGLTFPIWVGGFNQASEWKKIGFDIFEDVIDHSYQNCDTLIERCYRAFADNIEILTNLEKSTALREQYFDRLLANQKLVHSDHIKRHRQQQVEKWPKILQGVIDDVIHRRMNLYN